MLQVLNVNWSAFLNGILLTLHSHGWNNGTHGGRQLDSGDLYLLPLAMWPTVVLLATVWASWLLMECSWGPVFASTGYVAHCCVIGHCVGVMAAHGVFLGTCICFHWLCGPLLCYWPLCGRHGFSWSVPRGGFCHLPPRPIPPRPASHPTHPLYYQY